MQRAFGLNIPQTLDDICDPASGWKSCAIFIATRCGEVWWKGPNNGGGAAFALMSMGTTAMFA